MYPRPEAMVLILLVFPATVRAAGPIVGDAKPAPARVAPSAPGGNGAAGPRAVQPDASKTPSAPPVVRLTPEEQALLSIREEAQARVAELVRRASATTDPAARHELQRQGQEIKHQAQIRFLETKISFARVRGDLAAVLELEMGLEQLLHPPARPVPTEPTSPVKGGAR